LRIRIILYARETFMHGPGGNWPRVLIRYAASMVTGIAVIAGAMTATLAADGQISPAAGQYPVTRLPAAPGDPGSPFIRVSDIKPAPPVGLAPSPFTAPAKKQVPAGSGKPAEPAKAGEAAEIAEPARLPPNQTSANPSDSCCVCQQPACICKPQFDKRELLRPLTLTRDGGHAEISVIPEGFHHKASADHMSNSWSALVRPFTMTNGPGGFSGVAASPPGLRRGTQFADARKRFRCVPALLRPVYLTNDGDLMEGAEEHRIVEYVRGLQTAITDWPGLLSEPFCATGAIAGNPVRNAIGLVAYQQEGDGSAAGGRSAGGDGESLEEVPAGEGTKQDDKKGIAGDEKLGTEPEDNSLQFLRFQTILLEPGETQFDVGVLYSITEDDFPLFLAPDGVVDTHVRQRRLIVPLELRYGLSKRMQAFVNVPFGWANAELNFDGFDLFENAGGIGDVRSGITFLLKQGKGKGPDITGTFAFSAPTGIDSFVAGPTLVSQPSLGDGFWTLSGDVLFINNIDPIVFFYGFGTRQGIERNFFGVTFAPGQEYSYNFGMGFAVNERVTLSGAFIGAYITEIHANGRRVQGTIQEPLSLRFSATIARNKTKSKKNNKKKLLEPFVEIGMTDDAAAGTFGLIQTY
jgi:hypothetical protein